MRIAISGAHFSGKSSLVEALSEALPQYATVDEPYSQLQDEGYEFTESLSIEELELLMERSLENLVERKTNVLFDRCPLDILGYLLAHADVEAVDLGAWLPRIQNAIAKLDLVVLVSIEKPDRIALPAWEDAAYRNRVDEILKEIILENAYGFDMDVLEVSGSIHMRAGQVLTHIRSREL